MSILVIVSLMQAFLGVWNTPPASLGELAFREAVRRAATPAPSRVVTDADLGPVPERSMPPVPPPVVMADETAGATKSVEKLVENKDETWWRARMLKARADVERDRLIVTALESRVNALTRDVANRDAPLERAALVAERLRAIAELERMRAQVAAGVEAISDIEDEARREGVPPGWLRGGAGS